MTKNNKRFRVAVPSDNPGGTAVNRSAHFGRCDCFTVATIENSQIKEISILANPPHVEGGCAAAVDMLADNGVTAIIVNGIGRHPLEKFREVGIAVYAGKGDIVKSALNALIDEDLSEIADDAACGGL